MKTIGLIGGMSWESTTHYYQRLNELVVEHLGGLHSARLILWNVEFDEIARMQRDGDWDAAGAVLADAAARLQAAGAQAILIGANTMHRVAPAVEAAIAIPLIHVADVTARAVVAAGHRRAALLGTRFTMVESFYRDRLAANGLEVVVPIAAEQDDIHRIIFEELVRGKFLPASRERFIAIMRRMQRDGSQAVILGCTEFGLLIRPEDAPDIPQFDTAELHCRAAVDWMLGGE